MKAETFDIPARTQTPSQLPPPRLNTPFVKTKILVVDDEPDALELIGFNLKAAGYEVITAVDGNDALKKARVFLPSLILLDLMIPEVDGLEVCKILRRDPLTSGIPIIMVTAKAAELDQIGRAHV